MNLKHLLPLSMMALAACGGEVPAPNPTPAEPSSPATPSTPEPPSTPEHPCPPETPTTPASCDATDLTVALSSPTADVSTKGTVTVQVALSGQADKVELLRNGSLLVALASPYTYTWDTSGTEEGAHTLTARVTCGGKVVDSEARTIRVDRTAPAVSARRPQPGAQQVGVSDSFQVEFSEPMLAASVTDAALTVKVGTTVLDKTLTLSQDGRTVTVTPVGLVAPATVELTLSAALTDRAGNALGLPSSPWSFSLPAWLPVGDAVPEETGQAFAWLPQLGFDADGAPLVAFRADNASLNPTQLVLLTRRWTGETWSEWRPRVPSPVSNVSFAADGAGRALLSYQRYESGQFNVTSQYVAPGYEPRSLNGGATQEPRVALAPNGDGLVARIQQSDYRGTVGRVWVSRVGATETTYPASSGADDTVALSNLDLAVDAQGLPIISYQDNGRGHLVKRYDGTQWVQLGAALSFNGYQKGRPVLTVDAEGRPVLAYRTEPLSPNMTSTIYVLRLEGNTWVPLGSILVQGYADSLASPPALVVGPQGRLVMAFSEWSSPVRVDVREWTGSVWKSLGTISQAGASALVGPGGLAVDKEGRLTVAVRLSVGGDPQVRVWRLNQ